nr:cupin domain-containing protein [Gallaecimonas mangrovi]
MDVGKRLRLLRKKNGLSQRELAKRAGVTNSTISMIEKNSVSPSVSSLKKVLSGLPLSLVDFFSMDLEDESKRKVVYRGEELLDVGSNGVVMKVVGKTGGKQVMSFMSETYPPQSDTGLDMLSHEGEEAGLVISGQLELTVGETVYQLAAGDGYYFDSSRPHRFRNPFDEPCHLVSCNSPATF